MELENNKALNQAMLQHCVAIKTIAKDIAYWSAVSRTATHAMIQPTPPAPSDLLKLSEYLSNFDSIVSALHEISEDVRGVIQYRIDEAWSEAVSYGQDMERTINPVDKLTDVEVRRKVFDMTKGTCAYCGVQLVWSGGASDQFCIEHVVPASKGGPDRIENYVPSCSSCNNSKKDGHVLVLIQRILNRTPHGLTELSKRMTGEQE